MTSPLANPLPYRSLKSLPETIPPSAQQKTAARVQLDFAVPRQTTPMAISFSTDTTLSLKLFILDLQRIRWWKTSWLCRQFGLLQVKMLREWVKEEQGDLLAGRGFFQQRGIGAGLDFEDFFAYLLDCILNSISSNSCSSSFEYQFSRSSPSSSSPSSSSPSSSSIDIGSLSPDSQPFLLTFSTLLMNCDFSSSMLRRRVSILSMLVLNWGSRDCQVGYWFGWIYILKVASSSIELAIPKWQSENSESGRMNTRSSSCHCRACSSSFSSSSSTRSTPTQSSSNSTSFLLARPLSTKGGATPILPLSQSTRQSLLTNSSSSSSEISMSDKYGGSDQRMQVLLQVLQGGFFVVRVIWRVEGVGRWA